MSDPINEQLAHRIRSLLAKTVENGATEAEAMMAAAKAAEMMAKHRLSQSDIEIGREPVGRMRVERPAQHKIRFCATAIARYTGCMSWREGKATTVFFGLYSDTLFAKHLMLLCQDAMDSATKAFQRTPAYHGSLSNKILLTAAFQHGMAKRIHDRLIEMAERDEPDMKTATGTALVPMRNALVQEAYGALGLKLTPARPQRGARRQDAYSAGQAAGDGVAFHRPVAGGGAAPLSIGETK